MPTKSLIHMLYKKNNDVFSDTVESYVNSHKYYLNSLREDINDSANFLRYLIYSSDLKSTKNITSNLNSTLVETNDNEYDSNHGTNLTAALIQMCIVILIFLIVFLVCKCNTILKYFRDLNFFPLTIYSLSEPSDETFRQNSFRDILCFTCYKFKMKRRFKNRRLRNQRFNRNRAIRKHERMQRSGSIYHRNKSGSIRTRVESSNLKISNYTLSGSIKTKRHKSSNPSTYSSPNTNNSNSNINNTNSRLQIQKQLYLNNYIV